jgi:hypothetical protein
VLDHLEQHPCCAFRLAAALLPVLHRPLWQAEGMRKAVLAHLQPGPQGLDVDLGWLMHDEPVAQLAFGDRQSFLRRLQDAFASLAHRRPRFRR